MAEAAWCAESAWAGVAQAGRSGQASGAAGVRVTLRDPVDMVTILARRGAIETVQRVVQRRWGFGLPRPGRTHFGPGGDVVGTAPGEWLAVGNFVDGGDMSDREGSAGFAAALEGLAAVTDQGDGRAMLDIGGPFALLALAKLVAIDLHPEVFTPGASAVTALARGSVQLWRKDCGAVTLAVPRTVAGSVWAAVETAAAEYGLDVLR